MFICHKIKNKYQHSKYFGEQKYDNWVIFLKFASIRCPDVMKPGKY